MSKSLAYTTRKKRNHTMTNFRLLALLVLPCGLAFSSALLIRVAAQKDFQITDVTLKLDEPALGLVKGNVNHGD